MGTAPVCVRMGFAVDVVGYGRRTAPEKVDVQRRLGAVLDDVLGALDLDIDDVDRQPSGDGMVVFLPSSTELHIALAVLLRTIDMRLAVDNRQHRDRLRLRMAAVVGPVGSAALGFSGNTVVLCSRLVDSDGLRVAMSRHTDADVAVLVSDQLYSYVVGEGHPGLDAHEFRSARVRSKHLNVQAWLWVNPIRQGRRWSRVAALIRRGSRDWPQSLGSTS